MFIVNIYVYSHNVTVYISNLQFVNATSYAQIIAT